MPSTVLRSGRPASTRASRGRYAPSSRVRPWSGGFQYSPFGSNSQYSRMPSRAYVARFGPTSSFQVFFDATSSTKSGAFGSSHSL